jgi:tRNA nucleotidyltransferase (CCA-adding enzyme)
VSAGVGWEHFEHEADIGVRGVGRTAAEAFEQAAVALTAILCDPAIVRATVEIPIRCSNPDREILFADWLNAIVYEMATRRMIFSRYHVEISNAGSLVATAAGEAVDVVRHSPAVEVKGATLTELAVRQRDDGLWVAQCVVDV